MNAKRSKAIRWRRDKKELERNECDGEEEKQKKKNSKTTKCVNKQHSKIQLTAFNCNC